MAAKGSLFRLLHDVFLDEYEFDVDYYRPHARLTLLHVVAKYGSSAVDWSPEKLCQIKKLVQRCSNLTLKNALGSNVLKCMKNKEATEFNQLNMGNFIEEAML